MRSCRDRRALRHAARRIVAVGLGSVLVQAHDAGGRLVHRERGQVAVGERHDDAVVHALEVDDRGGHRAVGEVLGVNDLDIAGVVVQMTDRASLLIAYDIPSTTDSRSDGALAWSRSVPADSVVGASGTSSPSVEAAEQQAVRRTRERRLAPTVAMPLARVGIMGLNLAENANHSCNICAGREPWPAPRR